MELEPALVKVLADALSKATEHLECFSFQGKPFNKVSHSKFPLHPTYSTTPTISGDPPLPFGPTPPEAHSC